MLSPYLQRFNNILASFQSKFPKTVWTPAFKDSLVNDFSFYSTKIEQSELDYGDTIRFLQDQLVPKGKLIGLLEVDNHRKILEALINHYETFDLSEERIKYVHKTLMESNLSWDGFFSEKYLGNYRNIPVVGNRQPLYENKEYVAHYNLEISMATYMELFQRRFNHVDNSSDETHLISALSYFHNKFLNEIHPFADGNGRTCRIVMGTLMMKNNCPPVFSSILTNDDMKNYIHVLIECEQQKSDVPFIRFLSNGMADYMENKISV